MKIRDLINIVEGRNVDLVNQARQMGIDPNSIPALRELEKLNAFHGDFMGRVAERAKLIQDVWNEMIPRLREEGKLPFEVGTRFTTPKSIEHNQQPWKVDGYQIDHKDLRKYGYRVSRDGEKSVMWVSDPAGDERIKLHTPNWDRAKHVAEWTPLTGPRAA